MSERPQGDDWWLASDGKWHPPEAFPPTSPSGSLEWWGQRKNWQKTLLVLLPVLLILAALGSLGSGA